MENDPTKILQASIEESKTKPLPFAGLAVDHLDKENDSDDAQIEIKQNQSSLTNVHDSLTPVPMKKIKSHTPNPKKKPPAGTANRQVFILGICGGPSSGMSTVAKSIKNDLNRDGLSVEIFTLLDFYKPIRGEL